MSDNPSEEEPSIEEILASIRQIISDDEEDDESTQEQEVVDDPIRHESNDVLELTDSMVEEEEPEPEPEPETVEVDMRDIEEEEPEPEPEPVIEEYVPEPEPEPVMQERPVAPPSDILSSSTQGAALSSLTKLTSKMPVNSTRSYDGVTLEDIVRELLHPMLREWMDDNLPPMVERLVQKELEKLTRRALDD
ncbi:MAG: DUF2497 domain-containing protein [Alphaproteobacteria bacterium]|nr:DUF2497 domain-containing protein [Alphaproteobacteria bacterium]